MRRASRLAAVFVAFVAATTVVSAQEPALNVDTVADGLEFPWSLAFLPDASMLVTERPGRLRHVSREGALSEPIAGIPSVMTGGQAGLLDIALDPDFARNRRIYFSFSEGEGGKSGTSVARGTLSENLTEVRDTAVIFRQEPKVEGRNHFGSRLAFSPDGMLFVTVGDRFAFRDEAQNLENHLGKVMRIAPDGSVPSDNPFVGRQSARPEIWSFGHRNVQAAAINPLNGHLWTVEHGAKGGDEVNDPEAGKNYGWPVISYGVDYSGAKLGTGTAREGMEQPIYYWDPSIAPSGMAFYTGDLFPDWKGDLFVGALGGKLLARLELDGDRVVREERLLQTRGERIRDVRQGPEGAIYLLTDSAKGRILRLSPRK